MTVESTSSGKSTHLILLPDVFILMPHIEMLVYSYGSSVPRCWLTVTDPHRAPLTLFSSFTSFFGPYQFLLLIWVWNHPFTICGHFILCLFISFHLWFLHICFTVQYSISYLIVSLHPNFLLLLSAAFFSHLPVIVCHNVCSCWLTYILFLLLERSVFIFFCIYQSEAFL